MVKLVLSPYPPAILIDGDDAAQRPDVFKRVAIHYQQVCSFTCLQGADLVGNADRFGGEARR